MSDVAVVALAVIQGICIGIMAHDFMRRHALQKKLLESEERSQEAAKVLSAAHNTTIQKYEEVNSRLHSLEMKQNQKDAQLGIKRF